MNSRNAWWRRDHTLRSYLSIRSMSGRAMIIACSIERIFSNSEISAELLVEFDQYLRRRFIGDIHSRDFPPHVR